MSGYRCVSYLDLCRLCTSSNGNKIQIFSEEGKERNLYEKIEECLPVRVLEDDRLPKILCSSCVESIETIAKFREKCMNSQTMLESCLNSSKIRDGGKVYIKDVGNRKSTGTTTTAAATQQQQQQHDQSQSNEMISIVSENTSAFTLNNTTNNISSPQTTNIYATVPFTTQSIIENHQKTASNNSKINGGQQTANDYLSSIIQAVGIQNSDDSEDVPQQFQQQPLTTGQYTINLDDSLLQKNKFHYKIEHANHLSDQDAEQQYTTFSNIDEFLRLKPSVQKHTVIQKDSPSVQTINLETTSNQNQQQHFNIVISPTSRSSTTNNNSTIITTNSNNMNQKCVKFVNAAGTAAATTTTTTTTNQISLQDLKLYSPSNKCYLPVSIKDESQYIAHIDTQNFVLPHGYVQMKLPSNITTIDGQQVVQLSPANFQNAYTIPANTQIHSSQKLNRYQTQHILQTMANASKNNNNNNNNKIINNNTNGSGVMNKKKNVLPTRVNKNLINPKGKLGNTAAPVIPSFTISQVNDALSINNNNNNNNNVQNVVSSVCSTFGGANLPNVQFATLQNVTASNVQQPIPMPKKSGITIQRIKTEKFQASSASTLSSASLLPDVKPVIGTIPGTIKKLPVIKNTTVSLNQNQNQKTKFFKNPLSQSTPKTTKKLLVQQIKNKTPPSMIGSTTITTSSTKINGMNILTATTLAERIALQNTMIKTNKPKNNISGCSTINITPTGSSSNPEEKPKCELCDKVFKRKEHLAQHAKLHLGLRPFKCEEGECTKAFSRKEHLLRHIISHTGKKMFNCDVCFKLFSRKDNLNKHKRSHDAKPADNKQALKLLLKSSPVEPIE